MARAQVALVPGASGGIGSAVVEALADAGFSLFLGARPGGKSLEAVAARLRERGVEVEIDFLDGTQRQSIAAWVEAALARFGRIDAVVNCMGRMDVEMTPFLKQDEADWFKVIELELIGTMRLAQCVAPHMIAQQYGRIVTIGSDAQKVGAGGEAANCAAKGGCGGFHKSLAREVSRHGVTVNTVCIGPIDTPLLTTLGGTERGGRNTQKMIAAIPMKRLGTPQEVAAVAAFLASPEASYVTGQEISVSGGLTMC